MPTAPTAFFTGRETELALLHERLQQGSVALTQAIRGLGGVGKTQTALMYAHRYRAAYTAVLWTRADSAEALAQGMAQLAVQLGIVGADVAERDAQTQALQQWLGNEANRGWLLIADNADFDNHTWTPARFHSLLPPRLTGSLLLTSRYHSFGPLGIGNPLQLNTMQPQEATAFLLRRTGRDWETLPETERQGVGQVAERLGYLPLALEQAGAYMAVKQKPFAGYAGEYERRAQKLLRDPKPEAGDYNRDGQTQEYHTVWTTWALNFQAVQEASPASADLLRASAFLSSDAIPGELVTKGAKEWSETLAAAFTADDGDADDRWDTYDDVLEPLARYSLIDKDVTDRTYTVHRLVQQVVRDGLTAAEQQEWRERIVQALAQITVVPEYENWLLCARLLPHWRMGASYITCDSLASVEAGYLLNQRGYYLQVRGLYQETEPLFVQALALRKQALGDAHPDVATSLNNLALLYRTQGRYAEAEPLYVQAMEIDRQALGEQHPNYATDLNNLAALYSAQGRYEEAEPLHQEALAVYKQALGEAHPDVATSLNNLAMLYSDQGRYADAEPLYVQALAVYKQALGDAHPDYATDLNNLAALYYALGRYADAEPLFVQALALRKQALGEAHPDVAISLNNLAMLYSDQGRYADAEPLYVQAMEIDRQALGEQHPDYATSLNNLAMLYSDQGRYADAEPLYVQALAVYKQALGDAHPDYATDLNNLAMLYYHQERYTEAEPLLKQVVGSMETALGAAHPTVALCCENYAAVLAALGRVSEAEQMNARAADVQEAHARRNAAP